MEDNMVAEVLVHLPVKSLTRCKCLSKKWYDFISYNSSFRQAYASLLSRRPSSPLMLGFFFNKDQFWNSVNGEEDKDEFRFLPTCTQGNYLKLGWDCPCPCPIDESLSFIVGHHLFVVASSNGYLLCSLESCNPTNYYICNPITMDWIALPKSSMTTELLPATFICLDLTKYQVVRGIWPKYTTFSYKLTMEIFSSETFQWKVFNVTCPCAFLIEVKSPNPCVVMNEKGVVYWLAVAAGDQLRSVVVFDPTKKALQLVKVPGEYNEYTECFNLSNGIVHYARHNMKELQIWMLDERDDNASTWFLRHRVELNILRGGNLFRRRDSHKYLKITGFHPLNPLLVFFSMEGKMATYNIQDSTTTVVCKMPNDFGVDFDFFAYVWPDWPPFFP